MPTQTIPESLRAEGIELLCKCPCDSLDSYLSGFQSVYDYIGRLRADLSDDEVRTVLLADLIPSAVLQLVTAGEQDTAERLLLFVSALRITPVGPRFADDLEASNALAKLRDLSRALAALQRDAAALAKLQNISTALADFQQAIPDATS